MGVDPAEWVFIILTVGMASETASLYRALKATREMDPMSMCDKCRQDRRSGLDTLEMLGSISPFLLWLAFVIIVALWPARVILQRYKFIRRGFKREHSCLRDYMQGKKRETNA